MRSPASAFTAEHTFSVDTTAPAVAVLEPRSDAVTSDPTLQLWGTGGLATGDDSEVTVKLWAGAERDRRAGADRHRHRRLGRQLDP